MLVKKKANVVKLNASEENTRGEDETALRKAISEYENGGVPVNLTDMSVNDYFNYWYENYVLKNLKKNRWITWMSSINILIGKY